MTPLLQLAETDRIAVATRDIAAGETVAVGDLVVTMAAPAMLGDKVALRAIAAGEKILKYRVPIGTASADIAPGEVVHTHNLRSDFIPTFTLEEGRRFGDAS